MLLRYEKWSRAFRLEELSEARQSVVNRVKAAEKERDGLDGAKAVAEAYLAKERECTATQSTIFQIFVRDGQARTNLPLHAVCRWAVDALTRVLIRLCQSPACFHMPLRSVHPCKFTRIKPSHTAPC